MHQTHKQQTLEAEAKVQQAQSSSVNFIPSKISVNQFHQSHQSLGESKNIRNLIKNDDYIKHHSKEPSSSQDNSFRQSSVLSVDTGVDATYRQHDQDDRILSSHVKIKRQNKERGYTEDSKDNENVKNNQQFEHHEDQTLPLVFDDMESSHLHDDKTTYEQVTIKSQQSQKIRSSSEAPSTESFQDNVKHLFQKKRYSKKNQRIYQSSSKNNQHVSYEQLPRHFTHIQNSDDLNTFLHLMYQYALQEGLMNTNVAKQIDHFINSTSSLEDRLKLYILLENLIVPVVPETLQDIAVVHDQHIRFLWWNIKPFYSVFGLFIVSIIAFVVLFSLLFFSFFSYSNTILKLFFLSIVMASSMGSLLFVLLRLQYHIVRRSYYNSMHAGIWIDYVIGLTLGTLFPMGYILLNYVRHVHISLWIYQVLAIIFGFLSYLFFIVVFSVLKNILSIFFGKRSESILWRYSTKKIQDV